MLSNCSDKIMTPISSTTNEWPQNQILDDHKSFMASSSSSSANNNNSNKVVVVMEKTTNQQEPPPHQPPLKCPRCDSSNTKFCYYNNYSLSQPRHFCKACKRYWTRGGTLRNVPVGGGCRKNKRVKRPQQPSNGGDGISSAAAAATTNPSVQSQIDLTPTSNHINNPLFYSQLPTNPHELNFPFSSFRVSNDHHNNGGYDHHLQPPHMNGLGLGFSSLGLMGSEVQNMNDQYNKNGFKQIQDHVNSSTTTNTSSVPLFSSAGGNNSIFFGSSNFGSTSTMASLLASGIQHHKFQSATHNYPGLMPYQEMQMGKQVKEEGQNNRLEWNPNPNPNPNPNQNPNQIEQINGSDPSSLVWSTTNLGAWFDPSNMGSSVPSLI